MPLSRREFAAQVASVTMTLPLAVLPAPAMATESPAAKSEKEPVDTLRTEAGLWLELIRTRYPDARLTPEVLQLVAGDVIGDILHCRRISSFPLKNADAPSFDFVTARQCGD